MKMIEGAVALRKMIQDIAGINHSPILYLVYVLLSATALFVHIISGIFRGRACLQMHIGNLLKIYKMLQMHEIFL